MKILKDIMKNNLYIFIKKYSFIKYLAIQFFLFLVLLLNLLINISPFHFWKKFICFLFGIKIGKGVTLCSHIRFLGIGNCTIGDNSIINRNCVIDNRYKINIGSNVSIAANSSIWTQGHNVNDYNFSITSKPVVIGNYVCVFSNCIILPGVILKKGCVVYPGSVVYKSFPKNSVIGGNPAKFLKLRNENYTYNINAQFWFN